MKFVENVLLKRDPLSHVLSQIPRARKNLVKDSHAVVTREDWNDVGMIQSLEQIYFAALPSSSSETGTDSFHLLGTDR